MTKFAVNYIALLQTAAVSFWFVLQIVQASNL